MTITNLTLSRKKGKKGRRREGEGMKVRKWEGREGEQKWEEMDVRRG